MTVLSDGSLVRVTHSIMTCDSLGHVIIQRWMFSDDVYYVATCVVMHVR